MFADDIERITNTQSEKGMGKKWQIFTIIGSHPIIVYCSTYVYYTEHTRDYAIKTPYCAYKSATLRQAV